jgi:hypothetical protein
MGEKPTRVAFFEALSENLGITPRRAKDSLMRWFEGFIKRFADEVFYPEEVAILAGAFDDAWAKLEASRAPFSREDYVAAAREILAKQIIRAAQRGERNRRRLTEDALFHLCRQKLTRGPTASSRWHRSGSD